MPKGGCRGCSGTVKRPFWEIASQTYCSVVCQSWTENMMVGIFVGAHRGVRPSWSLLGGL